MEEAALRGWGQTKVGQSGPTCRTHAPHAWLQHPGQPLHSPDTPSARTHLLGARAAAVQSSGGYRCKLKDVFYSCRFPPGTARIVFSWHFHSFQHFPPCFCSARGSAWCRRTFDNSSITRNPLPTPPPPSRQSFGRAAEQRPMKHGRFLDISCLLFTPELSHSPRCFFFLWDASTWAISEAKVCRQLNIRQRKQRVSPSNGARSRWHMSPSTARRQSWCSSVTTLMWQVTKCHNNDDSHLGAEAAFYCKVLMFNVHNTTCHFVAVVLTCAVFTRDTMSR